MQYHLRIPYKENTVKHGGGRVLVNRKQNIHINRTYSHLKRGNTHITQEGGRR